MLKRTLLWHVAGAAAIVATGLALIAPAAAAPPGGMVTALPPTATPSPQNTFVRIENVNSGLNARQQNNVAYQFTTQSSLTGSNSVQWEKVLVNGGSMLQFRNKFSQWCLGDNGSPVNGGAVIQIPCDTGDPSQWWILDPVSGQPGQYYAHHWGTPYYLDVASGSTADGAHLVQWVFTANQSQRWRIPRV
jgi:hypothetical protein